MKVKELIEELQKQDPEAEVCHRMATNFNYEVDVDFVEKEDDGKVWIS